MNKEIYQLFVEKTEEKSLCMLILLAIKQFGQEATFNSIREFYLQENIDIYQELTKPKLLEEGYRNEFFLLRDIVKELVPFTKIKHINSLLNCLNFYLFNCSPGELTLSFVLDNLSEWLNKNPEALNASLNVLENNKQINFHCLIIEKIFSSLCYVDLNEGKERIFAFLERTREHELVGAIGALNSLTGYDNEIIQKMQSLLQQSSSNWVITNIVLILLRLCKRNVALIKEVSDICDNLLDKNYQLVVCLVERGNEFLQLGKAFEHLLIRATKFLQDNDERSLLCLDSTLLKCLKSEGRISFVLEILCELLLKKQEYSDHLNRTIEEIRKSPSYLSKTLMFFLSKPLPQYWRISAHFTSSIHNDQGMDLLFLQTDLTKELQKNQLPIAKLIYRIVYGMFLLPRSVLSLFLIIFQWVKSSDQALQVLKILYSPFAINYCSFCTDFFEERFKDFNDEKKELMESFLFELRNVDEHIKKARTELQVLRLTEKESLLVGEFEDIKARDIYIQSMEKSIFNKLGIHRETILYGRGVLYYQRTSDDKIANRSISKLTTFSTTINWPLMALVCPSVLDHILLAEAMEGQE